MEKYVYAVGIIVVFLVAALSLLRPRLTKSEQEFMSYVLDQAKLIRLPKEEICDFVSENFDQLKAEFSVNGPPTLSDESRLVKIIATRY